MLIYACEMYSHKLFGNGMMHSIYTGASKMVGVSA